MFVKSGPRKINRSVQMDEVPLTVRQIVILVLCIYVLIALFVDTAFNLPSEVSNLLNGVDNFVCFIFIFGRSMVACHTSLSFRGCFVICCCVSRSRYHLEINTGLFDLPISVLS